MSQNRELYTEARVSNEKPSAIVAYALWFFFGYLGAHRFYLRRYVSGFIMLVFFGLGTLTAPILIGWIPLTILGIWWLLDLFFTNGIIHERMDEIRSRARVDWMENPRT